MRKVDYKNLIKESEEELEEYYKKASSEKEKLRCELLLWLKSGKVESAQKAASLKGLNKYYGNQLWSKYKKEGITGFVKLKYKGQVSPLQGKQELEDHLKTGGFSSIKAAQAWILSTYGIAYTENGLGNYFRAKKIKLKTGRPYHPKQKEADREDYKKNMKKN